VLLRAVAVRHDRLDSCTIGGAFFDVSSGPVNSIAAMLQRYRTAHMINPISQW
jgi:hypothetical protein